MDAGVSSGVGMSWIRLRSKKVTYTIKSKSKLTKAVCKLTIMLRGSGRLNIFERVAKSICPPSSTGMGRRLKMARLTLMRARNQMKSTHP